MMVPSDLRERQLAIVLVDLARFTQAVAGLDLRGLASIVSGFYRTADDVVSGYGGRVVKFVGDGCLAVFEPDEVLRALEAVEVLRSRVGVLGVEHGLELDLDLGANVHVSTVVEGAFGLDGAYEVVGMGVIHAFRMGSGAGTRISEPVYRRLPSGRRSPWRKHQPPATYALEQ
jgi:class 3 adenylate cyclase